jgi:Xaa-Pro aminopeptidase
MLNRRTFVASAAAAGLVPGVAGAQIPSARRYGLPAGTRPFGPQVYRERRRRLMERMQRGVAIVYGAPRIDLSSSIGSVGRQDSDFAYLTGLMDEPGAALILAPQERRHREILFLPSRDPEMERWEGSRLPIGQELRERAGFERVLRMQWLGATLTQIASRAGELHYLGPLVSPESPVPQVLDLYGRVAQRVPGTRIVNNHNLVRSMRAVKEPRELELMRRAIAATARGHQAALRAARPGMREFELKAIIENAFRAAGARGVAFPSIVGAARNTAVLHYPGGDNLIQRGDMILLDIGAEVDFYAADVTRTFPVDGRFTPEQRRVHDLVLQAQEAAAALLRPGAHYEDLQEASDAVIRRAGHADDSWHGLGHFVGLDVHDVGDLAQPLPAGAVVTIEPGIYLPDREFGVRIEDEYLVTASGSERLSRAIPRSAADIEAAMAA